MRSPPRRVRVRPCLYHSRVIILRFTHFDEQDVRVECRLMLVLAALAFALYASGESEFAGPRGVDGQPIHRLHGVVSHSRDGIPMPTKPTTPRLQTFSTTPQQQHRQLHISITWCCCRSDCVCVLFSRKTSAVLVFGNLFHAPAGFVKSGRPRCCHSCWIQSCPPHFAGTRVPQSHCAGKRRVSSGSTAQQGSVRRHQSANSLRSRCSKSDEHDRLACKSRWRRHDLDLVLCRCQLEHKSCCSYLRHHLVSSPTMGWLQGPLP